MDHNHIECVGYPIDLGRGEQVVVYSCQLRTLLRSALTAAYEQTFIDEVFCVMARRLNLEGVTE